MSFGGVEAPERRIGRTRSGPPARKLDDGARPFSPFLPEERRHVRATRRFAVATDKYPAWAETFRNHLDLAIKLHSIRQVIAVDHRDCGAFKLVFGKDYGQIPDEETQIHTKVMSEFRDLVKKKQPNVEVELLLMWLDGHVQPIGDGAPAMAPASFGRH